MAASTVTELVLRKELYGQRRVWDLSINVTAAGDDGHAIAAGTGALSGWKQIEMVLVTGAQENGGYVIQYIPTTLPVAAGALGNGKLRVYEAGADGDVLDEVVTGDLGVFIVRVEGY
jgi:hypothetical protein